MITIEDCLTFARKTGAGDLEVAHLEDELSELRWKAEQFDAMPSKLGYTCTEGEFAGLPTRCITALRQRGIETKAQVAALIAQHPDDWQWGFRGIGSTMKRKIEIWANTTPTGAAAAGVGA